MNLIGRKQEKDTFKHCLESTESKLIALYGRRRVGKTFLVRKYFQSKIRFEIAGLHDEDMKDQLAHFAATLAKYGWQEASLHPPSSWKAAFDLLERFISSMKGQQKKVIFLDELPWFDTPKSKFLAAFENFWNSYCTKRSDVLCVICGSAASWMIKKILKNKGGLHNRVAEKIRLTQFNLKEVQFFLKAKGIKWSQYDIAQLYLTTGGVPFYLDAVRKGESVVQFVNRVCFIKDGILVDEYKKTNLASGGTLTTSLKELEEAGFIETVVPYQKNKTKVLYKLVDSFIIFYLKFMSDASIKRGRNWSNITKSQSWISWSGLAFERLCFAHLPQIKRALKLEAIECIVAPWMTKHETEGAQIDLLIDRADRVVNVCEIKFVNADFTIDKNYAKKLRNKIYRFSEIPTNKRKNIFLTMITTFGLTHNEYYRELVQSEVVLEDLFL